MCETFEPALSPTCFQVCCATVSNVYVWCVLLLKEMASAEWYMPSVQPTRTKNDCAFDENAVSPTAGKTGMNCNTVVLVPVSLLYVPCIHIFNTVYMCLNLLQLR